MPQTGLYDDCDRALSTTFVQPNEFICHYDQTCQPRSAYSTVLRPDSFAIFVLSSRGITVAHIECSDASQFEKSVRDFIEQFKHACRRDPARLYGYCSTYIWHPASGSKWSLDHVDHIEEKLYVVGAPRARRIISRHTSNSQFYTATAVTGDEARQTLAKMFLTLSNVQIDITQSTSSKTYWVGRNNGEIYTRVVRRWAEDSIIAEELALEWQATAPPGELVEMRDGWGRPLGWVEVGTEHERRRDRRSEEHRS